ncbi:cytochrome P450 [Annulohypoxylon truncatum]|uniref:cytochrome P450 n=1 Tax=Annulohypoxylon truncatum TaxID=327061 RepID=UPI0020072FBE|nr:cytochrome P450 [Annulohypoxylon truncatum]KAI1210084.1 cytochrome P450 [Annulohypoxylon truncatum]
MELLQSLLLHALNAAFLTLIYHIAIGIHRLLFHPLRKYPGPLTAKLSGFYGAYYAWGRNLHLKTWEDHKKYGPVVRQGPNKLVFNSAGALRDIYQNERITKSRAYLIAQRAPSVWGLFSTMDRQMHQKKRKLLGPVVGNRSLQAFEPTMIDQVDIFLRNLLLSCQDNSSTPVNMTERFSYLTMDIMSHFVFGYPLNLQSETVHRFMTRSTPNIFLNVALQLPFLSKIPVSYFRHIRALLRGSQYHNTQTKMIKARLAKSSHAKQDLLYMSDTLQIPEDDNTFIEEARSEATFILLAGSDTMSTCLSALFFYLSRNTRCYQRLVSEIRSTFRNGGEIRSGSRLASCRYLRACLDEALRMSPPIPGTLWREQVLESYSGTDPLVIDGHIIPPGTEVGVNTYALHHNENYFPEPFEFKPERFLSGDVDIDKRAYEGFAPFSIGPRGCIGKSMAYTEASIIVAKTLWYFDFEQAQGEAGELGKAKSCGLGRMEERIAEYHIRDVFATEHDGPCLNFRPREHYAHDLGKVP